MVDYTALKEATAAELLEAAIRFYQSNNPGCEQWLRLGFALARPGGWEYIAPAWLYDRDELMPEGEKGREVGTQMLDWAEVDEWRAQYDIQQRRACDAEAELSNGHKALTAASVPEQNDSGRLSICGRVVLLSKQANDSLIELGSAYDTIREKLGNSEAKVAQQTAALRQAREALVEMANAMQIEYANGRPLHPDILKCADDGARIALATIDDILKEYTE